MADVSVKFGASIADLVDGVQGARAAIESIKESTDRVTSGFRTLAEVIGISLSLEGFKSFVEGMASLGTQTEVSMARLGMSAENVGLLGGVAKITGTDFEGLERSIERFSLNVQKSTRDAYNPAAQGLKALDLSARDLTGIPTDQWIERLADAVSRFNPSMNLTNAVMAAGGRGVAQMMPLLLQGSAHFREMEEAVCATGSALSAAQAGAFAQTHEKLTLLGLSVQGLGIKIFDTLRPAIDAAVTSLTSLVQNVKAEDIRDAANYVGRSEEHT